MADAFKTLSTRYLDARTVYEDLRARTAEAKEAMDNAEADLISYMTDVGIDSLKTEDGVGFTRQRKTVYACLAENRPMLLNMLEAEGYDGDLLRTYTGKFDVSDSSSETYFDLNGKRVIIQGGIVINEEV